MKRRAVRQGDVLVVPIEPGRAQGQAVPPVKGKVILAEGEQTGHHHYLDAAPGLVMLDDGIDTFIQMEGRQPLKHQEHTALDITSGDSEVIRQRRVMPGSEHLVHAVSD